MATVDMGKEKSKLISLDGIRFDLVVHRYSDGRVFASARAYDTLEPNKKTEWMCEPIEDNKSS